MVAVKPIFWLAAGSGTKVAAACKSATWQAQNTTKMVTEDDKHNVGI